jgi:hypothetical protein
MSDAANIMPIALSVTLYKKISYLHKGRGDSAPAGGDHHVYHLGQRIDPFHVLGQR